MQLFFAIYFTMTCSNSKDNNYSTIIISRLSPKWCIFLSFATCDTILKKLIQMHKNHRNYDSNKPPSSFVNTYIYIPTLIVLSFCFFFRDERRLLDWTAAMFYFTVVWVACMFNLMLDIIIINVLATVSSSESAGI